MNKRIKNLIIDSILLAVLIIASKISIYTGFVPFTLQILVVLIISLLLDYKESLIVLGTYVLIGLLGIPVFSSNAAGIAALITPSFGFVIGFLVMSLIIPLLKRKLKQKINNQFLLNLIPSLIGLIIDYAFGFIYALFLYKILMVLKTEMTVLKILLNFVILFIPFDLVKCVLSSIIVERLEKSNIIEVDQSEQ